MIKYILFIGLIFIPPLASAQENSFANAPDFNGYIQIRGTSNFTNYTSFSVRRLKLWLRSKPEYSKNWSYKIQVTFSSFSHEKFFLQDVKVKYQTGLFSFDIGQFVPQFSLQRFQPDYKIETLERAKAINTLIPNGTLGVRDIGLQANFKTKNKLFETHLGVFNGYGIKEYRFDNQGYMLTHKSSFQIPVNQSLIKLGYSLQYRYAENLQMKSILPDTILFSGHDFRYNLFAMYKSKSIKLQTEFLQADLENDTAFGYYFLSAYTFKKNQVVISFEKYKDLIEETSDDPYCRIGYNYFIKEYKIKLSLDSYFQISGNSLDYYNTNVQLQIFLN